MGFLRIGSETLIDATFASYNAPYSLPRTATLADGRFVAMWTDDDGAGDTDGTGIVGRLFNADGSTSGAEFLVNTTTGSYQEEPNITALSDGRFVVVWISYNIGIDTSFQAIAGQIFNANGTKSGGEFLVNSTTLNGETQPRVTALSDGRFVAVWAEFQGDQSLSAVRGRIFNLDGTPAANDFLINTFTENDQQHPVVTALDGGRFAVFWDDASPQADDSQAIRGRIYAADGTPAATEFRINATTLNDQFEPAAATLTDGRIVIAWHDNSATGGDTDVGAVRATILDSNGGATSVGEFLVNTSTAGVQRQPAVAALTDGRFVIVWSDYSNGSAWVVRAQVYGADGARSGQEVLVSAATGHSMIEPDVSALQDGGFVVTWTDYDSNTADTTPAFQIFNPTIFYGETVGETVIGGSLDDNFYGYGGADFLHGEDGDDMLNGGAGIDELYGGGDDDRLYGGASADVLLGGDGDDRLDGGVSDDQLLGGLGDDTYVIDSINDLITESSGQGVDTIQTTVSYILGNHIENGTLLGAAAINLTGNAQNNLLIGNNAANVLDGGSGGADEMRGGFGDDRYYLNSTSDVVVELAGQGYDRVYCNNNFDASTQDIEYIVMTGSLSRNLTGNGLDNEMYGNDGVNILIGAGGDDYLDGGGGGDEMRGGTGDDVFVVNASTDVVIELAGEGRDSVRTSVSFNLSGTNVEDAELTGSLDRNLIGSAEANTLEGNDGANTLVGAGGADILTGGAGVDRFDFNAVAETSWNAYDRITDLETTDIIDLASIDANTMVVGNQSFILVAAFTVGQAGQLRVVYSSTSGDTYVQGDVDGDAVGDFRIRLTGDHSGFTNFVL